MKGRYIAHLLSTIALVVLGYPSAAQETEVRASGSVEIRRTAPRQARGPIRVVVNGEPVAFPDQGPAMVSNRVMVPMRGVFERLNATVTWNPTKEQVLATRGDTTVELYIGKTVAVAGGRQITLDQPARLINGRAMVPLRFLATSLGATVDWRASDMTVEIRA